MKDFTADEMKRIIRQVIEGESRDVARAVHTKIVERTPVDTGNARQGWKLNKVTAGYEILNEVPYITILEAGRFENPGRGSPQAPRGMVDVTLADLAAGVLEV